MLVVQEGSWHLLTLIKLSPKIFLSRPEDLEAFAYVLIRHIFPQRIARLSRSEVYLYRKDKSSEDILKTSPVLYPVLAGTLLTLPIMLRLLTIYLSV